MEHEIIGHTKKAYKTLKNPNKPASEKAKEILIEVLIIVFAVTFAAFIERTREHYKEKAEAKEFIIGLKGDLVNEIKQIQRSKEQMDTVVNSYNNLLHLKLASVDSIEKNHSQRSFFIPKFDTRVVNGRYDGFKASGRIQTIENDSLRNNILKFYEEDIPFVDFTEKVFNTNQQRLEDLIINHADENSNKPVDVLKMLASTKGKFIINFSLSYSSAALKGYDGSLKQADKIIAAINKETE